MIVWLWKNSWLWLCILLFYEITLSHFASERLMELLHLGLYVRKVEWLVLVFLEVLLKCLLKIIQEFFITSLCLLIFGHQRVHPYTFDELVSPGRLQILIFLLSLQVIIHQNDELLAEWQVAQSDLLKLVDQEVEHHILYVRVTFHVVFNNVRQIRF